MDAAAESMPLNLGGANGTTTLVWVKDGGSGNGCDLTGQQTYRADVVSSNPGVAVVSPASVTFASCGDVKTLTVTPKGSGTTTISLLQTANTSDYAVDAAPATFTVTVASNNSAPTVAVTGVTHGASYSYGAIPTARCSVTDREDGTRSFDAALSPITGPNSTSGIGTQTASCSATDSGGLSATTSATYTIIPAPSTTTVVCSAASVVYDGKAQTPCTATVTGNGLNTTATVTYSPNTAVGTVTASAAYAGSPRYTASSGSATFAITKAASTTSVTCPSAAAWTGSALEPCTAKVTGAGGLDTGLALSYSANTAVGTATASASFAGDGNHTASSNFTSFEIVRAASTVAITCTGGQVYAGTPVEPCTAEVTSAGRFSQALAVTYGNNVDAGTATATATFAGDSTHAPASHSTSFAIAKATSTVIVVCNPTSTVYTGKAQLPCTASADGPGIETPIQLTPRSTDNTNAGTAHVSAAWGGDDNHTGSTGSATFEITPAASSITLSCSKSEVYTGSAIEPCTAYLSGAGIAPGRQLAPDYSDNVDVGTAGASASWDGDANHTPASTRASFEITKAPSTVTVTCNPKTVTYTGAAQTPCTAAATGAGITTPVALTPHYASNTNAGTATASASYAGDDNHDGAENSATFTIEKATSEVTVSCPTTALTYNGSAQTPCSATVTGAGDLDAEVSPVTYENNVNAGTATARASYAGDANHLGHSGSATFAIGRYTPVVSVHCPDNAVYAGETYECTSVVSGVGDELASATAELHYTGSTINAGDVSVVGSYTAPEGSNYSDATGVGAFTIAKFRPTVTLTCPSGATYDGAAHVCTATVAGVGSELLGVVPPVTYSANGNVNAGQVTATGTYAGGGNYESATSRKTFTISKAQPIVTVTCPTPSVEYNAAAHPCTASVKGVGDELDKARADIDYGTHGNVNAGDVTATGTYAGSDNYLAATGTGSFTITKFKPTVTLTCPTTSVEYDATAHTCTATVKGVGDELDDATADVDYGVHGNVDAGQVTATATYAGSGNYEATTKSGSFTITKAPSAVNVTCDPASLTYTGAPLEPCAAAVSGIGGLSEAAGVDYRGNTDAGTATASATYAGDSNHNSSEGSATFTITKAASSVTVTCATGPFTYDGTAFTPCSARVTGAGNLDAPVTPVAYGDNTNAGTVTAGARYAGDANHDGAEGSTTFTIRKAPSLVTVTCTGGPYYYTGSPITATCSARATGAGGLETAVTPVTFSDNTNVGTATASAIYGGDANHLGNTGKATFTISAWRLGGFYQPVDMGGVLNTVKGGSTVPLKFEIFSGATELTSPAAVKSFSAKTVNCAAGSALDDLEMTATGGTSLRYDATGGQFIQNWQTPKGPAGSCIQVTMTTADNSTLQASFKLK